MVYRRHGSPVWLIAVPTRTGRVKRSTGTTHRGTARAMERMLVELGPHGQRAWDLLDRLYDNTLTLSGLFDAWRQNDLAGLRARQGDVDLGEHVAAWTRWLADRVAADTAAHYLAHLRTLVPEGQPFPRSQFTVPTIATWLAGRTALPRKRRASTRSKSRRKDDAEARPISGATRRKYLAAARSFGAYLCHMGVIASNPVRDVEAPPASKPRVVELDLRDVRRIVEGADRPYRALFALLYGAGVEISAALRCVESDIDIGRREVRARGTKAHTRDRIVRVAEWAWPFLAEHVATLTPGERLFRGLDRWHVGSVHRERLRVLGLPHHRLHDARHFFAVRAVRAGTPYELVARQLGHADVQMVARTYGRYAPRSDERDRWERIAAQLDAEKVGGMGALGGAAPEKDDEPRTVSPWPVDSRGGTRTRDPGIMSAVL